MNRTRAVLGLGLVLLSLLGGIASAQDPDAAEPASTPKAAGPDESDPKTAISRQGLLTLVKSANPMVWPMALCSIVTLGFALERLVALRKNRVIPRDFVERFHDRLSSGKLDRDRAGELCHANNSPIGRVFGVIVSHWGQPAAAIRQAVAHDAAAEVLDLRRNVRVLNATATLAPLLGLLGTVFGMIEAFEATEHAAAGVSKGEMLAHGIRLALMATAAGLIIAIVSVAMYYYLLHRVDHIVRAMDDHARKVIDLVASDPLPPTTRPMADRRVVGDPYHRGEPRTLGRSEPL